MGSRSDLCSLDPGLDDTRCGEGTVSGTGVVVPTVVGTVGHTV